VNNHIQHNILTVNNLAIGYKAGKQVNSIAEKLSFSVEKGDFVAIVGANGIGKSTLLRTLSQVQPMLSGSIQLHNKSLQKYSPISLAKQLSLVLTEQILAKNLTVKEVVALGRQPYTNWIGTLTEKDVAKIKEAISLVKIEELVSKKCYELSDGQLQKVMIARALAQDTPLIILDEPTTHLDIYHKAYILKLLQNIAHTTQRAIVYSSHEIDLAIQLCDKMLIMAKEKAYYNTPCKLIEQGAFEELFPKDLIRFNPENGKFTVNK
jgi:iron complex transport system ATP-binding protein